MNCQFEPRTDTSSATICKHCGKEKFFHNILETFYTEEQVKKAVEMSKDIKYITYSTDEIIQSLKQGGDK